MSTDDRFVRAYVDALDLIAIYATTSPAKARTRLGRGKDPAATLKAMREADPAAALNVIGWCRPSHVEFIIMTFVDELPAKDVALDLEGITERALQVAESLGVQLQSDDELRQMAEAAVARIETLFEQMMSGGELRALNRRYRQYRLSRKAAGNGSVSYPRWLENYKAEFIRKMAAGLSPGDRDRLAS
jgi:hypothetical protein